MGAMSFSILRKLKYNHRNFKTMLHFYFPAHTFCRIVTVFVLTNFAIFPMVAMIRQFNFYQISFQTLKQ